MDPELPKQIFRSGYEPLVKQVNNSCRTSLMNLLHEAMPSEFAEVKREPVFEKILAIHENCLGFSGRMVHSLMCRQIITAKLHELWFIFAKRPLRFSLQEFHAVTGLKCTYDEDCASDFEDWIDDNGYWSKLLRSGKKINLKMIKTKDFLAGTRKWLPKDRSRLILLCVIAGLVMARDDKVYISHSYVKLVMDIEKLRKYPWGIDSFDLLIESINKTREKLTRKVSYVLDGFSYALQIWVMEAIPDIGILLGKKLKEGVIEHPRCSNWSGAAKVSYEDIIILESAFQPKGTFYPYISKTGNMDVFDSLDFTRDDEMTDDKVDAIKGLIRVGFEWAEHTWEVDDTWLPKITPQDEEEVNVVEDAEIGDAVDEVGTPTAEDTCVSGFSRSKKRKPDHGAVSRKQKLLCERSAAKSVSLDEDMKTFLKGLIESSFTSMEERFGKKVDDRFTKLETQVLELRNEVANAITLRNHVEPVTTSNPTCSDPSKATVIQRQGKVRKQKNYKS